MAYRVIFYRLQQITFFQYYSTDDGARDAWISIIATMNKSLHIHHKPVQSLHSAGVVNDSFNIVVVSTILITNVWEYLWKTVLEIHHHLEVYLLMMV